jgi:hypothetical protein
VVHKHDPCDMAELYALDGLEEEEKEVFEEHLKTCTWCQEEVKQLRKVTDGILDNVPIAYDLPKGAKERVMSHAFSKRKPNKTNLIINRTYKRAVLGTIGLVAASVLAVYTTSAATSNHLIFNNPTTAMTQQKTMKKVVPVNLINKHPVRNHRTIDGKKTVTKSVELNETKIGKMYLMSSGKQEEVRINTDKMPQLSEGDYYEAWAISTEKDTPIRLDGSLVFQIKDAITEHNSRDNFNVDIGPISLKVKHIKAFKPNKKGRSSFVASMGKLHKLRAVLITPAKNKDKNRLAIASIDPILKPKHKYKNVISEPTSHIRDVNNSSGPATITKQKDISNKVKDNDRDQVINRESVVGTTKNTNTTNTIQARPTDESQKNTQSEPLQEQQQESNLNPIEETLNGVENTLTTTTDELRERTTSITEQLK